MTILDQIKEGVAELVSQYGHDSEVVHQNVTTYVDDPTGRVYVSDTPLITCKDCKYGKAIESIGCIMFNPVYSRLRARDPDGFCAWAERRDA